MTTARKIVEKAARKINVLGAGQSLTADEANDFLDMLNDMQGSWSVEGGYVFTETRETFPLNGSTSYTIGAGGDFNTERPFDISNMYVTNGSTDYPLERYDKQKYANIIDKLTSTGTAGAFYYDNNSPLGNIFLYPIPGSAYTVTIYSFKRLEKFTSLDDDITLPPGMERALVFNLAVEAASDFETILQPKTIEIAETSKNNVFAYNARNSTNETTVDNALISGGNFNANILGGY